MSLSNEPPRSVPKPTKAEKKIKPYMKKRPKKKKRPRNPLKKEIYKGRTIPTKQKRGKITTAEYNEALRQHGEFCHICGVTTGLEAHHIRFRSKSGRGKWRNIRFLCYIHHRGDYSPHQNEELRQELEALHVELYGEWFWADEYDLFKAGKIPTPTEECYERFMKEAKGSGET